MSVEVTDIPADADQRTLPVSLSTKLTTGGRLVATWLLGLFISVPAGVLGWVAVGSWPESRLTALGVAAVAVIFGLIALLLLWSALRQTLAYPIPVTKLELSQQPMAPGDLITLCVKQPGPVNLSSLRANLVAIEQVERKSVGPDGEARYERLPARMTLHENILDTGAARIQRGLTRQWTTTFTVPDSAKQSGKEDSLVARWSIEVWGKAGFGLVGFLHQFPVRVRSARQSTGHE